MNVLASILSVIFILLKCALFKSTALAYIAKPHTSSHVSSEYGNLANISTKHILSAGINGNDKIFEKLITLIPEFASNFKTYKVIKLSVNKFLYPPKFVEIELFNRSALFYIINASQKFDSYNNQLFTTSVECDTSGIGRVEVSLPPTMEIQADLIIRSRKNDAIANGKIVYVMKNCTLLKQSILSNKEWNSESNIMQRLFCDCTEVKLKIDTEYRQIIYEKLNTFISNVESSLGNHLLNELNAELVKRNATFSTWSKFMKINQANLLKSTDISPLLANNAFLSDLYIAPANVKSPELSALSLCILQNFKQEFGQIITLNPNSIIVEGISNFTNIKTTFSYLNNPCWNLYNKTMIMRIKSRNLTGKFTWTYCRKANHTEVRRDIDFLFKVDCSEMYININRYCYYKNKYDVQNPQIGINLNNIQITSILPETYCANEGKFLHHVLDGYLQVTIGESLKNSIARKLNENRSLIIKSFNN